MAMHMAKIDGTWRCTTCAGQNFRDKTDLRRHVEAKHCAKLLRYKCNLCGYITKTSYYFRKHQLMHERHQQQAILEQNTTTTDPLVVVDNPLEHHQ